MYLSFVRLSQMCICHSLKMFCSESFFSEAIWVALRSWALQAYIKTRVSFFDRSMATG